MTMKILRKAIPIFIISVLICSLQVPIRAAQLDEVLNPPNQIEITQEQEAIPTPETIKEETPAVQENDEQSGKGYNFIDNLQNIDLQEDKLIVNDRNVTEEVNGMTYKISATITQNTGIHNFLFNSSKSNVRLSLHINSVQQEITESQFPRPSDDGGTLNPK